MCAGHIIVPFLFRPAGALGLLINVDRCLTAPAGGLSARWALLSLTYTLAVLAVGNLRNYSALDK